MIDMKALLEFFDDEALVRKYLERFVEDMPKLIQQMRKAYTDQHWNELSIHAHSYKSQMQYIQDDSATYYAHELEKLSLAPGPGDGQIEFLINLLENKLEDVLLKIQEIIE